MSSVLANSCLSAENILMIIAFENIIIIKKKKKMDESDNIENSIMGTQKKGIDAFLDSLKTTGF